MVQHSVTIPEGLTSEQIVARLSENDIFSGNIREIPREGTLLPETYKFPRGTSREQVVQRMQQAQKRVLAEVWERHNPDYPSRRLNNSSRSHRSSKRKPASRMNAAGSRRCSSIA